MQDEIKKKIKETFKSNPKHDEYWVTTDGNAFTNEQKAVSHSFNLERKNRDVQHIKRADALKDEKAILRQAQDSGKKAAEAKAKKEAEEKAKQDKNQKESADTSKSDEAKSDEKQATDKK